MSPDADTGAAETVALFASYYTGEYCQVAASAVFIYDAFVTFEREVTCVWTAKRSGASLLFFANKWLLVMYYVVLLFQHATFLSDKVTAEAIVVLQLFPGAVFSALRAYVLSRSKLLGLLVLALSLAPSGANMVHFGYDPTGVNFPPFGCLFADNTTMAINLRSAPHYVQDITLIRGDCSVIIIARVPVIIADMLLICITWAKLSSRGALRDVRQPQAQSKRLSLSDILFRDGTIYFVVLFTLNSLHLVLSATAIVTNGSGSYVTYFTAPLTAILVSRFLIDLQEANHAVVRVDPDDPLHSSRDPYDAASFISSFGAFINPDLSAPSRDDLRLDGEEESRFQAAPLSRSSSSV